MAGEVIRANNALLREAGRRRLGKDLPAGLILFGVQGAVPKGKDGTGNLLLEIVPNVPDRYNDTIGHFGPELAGYLGSVDPGAVWTRQPSNPKGCAHLLPGVWTYQRGQHRGHEALVQAAEVTVRRDRDRDAKPEAGEPLDTGWFGINIHAAGTAPQVGAWSAGCQVIAGGWTGAPWLAFKTRVYAASQQRFLYCRLDAADLVR